MRTIIISKGQTLQNLEIINNLKYMPRYQILESTSLVDIFWGDVGVRVKDTETGNSARATAKNTADAERQAWDKLKEKQGPSPSEMR